MSIKKGSVYLESISLENWAQYEQFDIKFPVPTKLSNEMPITYFIARNGAGKTRLFQAIRVTLFGEDDSSIKDMRNLFSFFSANKKEKIINELTNNRRIPNQKIKLELVYKEITNKDMVIRHKITRTYLFSNFIFDIDEEREKLQARLIKSDLEYETKESVLWNPRTSEELDILLNLWFPEETRDFYFFDGERLNELMVDDQDSKEDLIQNIILRKSDHYRITQINETLLDLEEKFEKQASKIKRKGKLVDEAKINLETVQEDISNHKESISEIERITSNHETNIREHEKLMTALNITDVKYATIQKNKEKLAKFRSFDKNLTNVYTRLNSLLGNQTDKIYDFDWILINDIFKEVLYDLNDKYEKDIIPSKVHKGMYNIILARKRCFCSSEKLTDKQRINVLKEKEKAIDERLNEEAKEFLSTLNDKVLMIDEKVPLIKQTQKMSIKLINQIQELSDIPADNHEDELKFLDYLRFKDEIDKVKPKLSALKVQHSNLIYELEGLKLVEIDMKDKLAKRKAAEGRIEESDLRAYTSRKVKEEFENYKKEINGKIISYIKEQTNNTFLSIIEPKGEYDRVFISDDWDFGFYTKECPNVPIYGKHGPSKGQFHILGISFLHSISGTTNCMIPIVFDTPLGRIDEIHKQNIGFNIAKLFNGSQVILFLTGSEATDMIDFISGKIGYRIITEKSCAKYREIEKQKGKLEATINEIEIENQKLQETEKTIDIEGD